MTAPIRSVAVIGSGVMGAGIAAQCANAGLRTLLLDIVPDDAKDRSVLARGALKRLEQSRPPAFAEPAASTRVIPGNIEDHLEEAGACDLVIEAVLEDLAVKRALYARLAAVRGSATIIASNTSTLSLADLTEGLPKDAARNFVITHFFNPPRYMRLVELVYGPATDADASTRAVTFCDESLGKRVVVCRDRPGFIANRLGTFWMAIAVRLAAERGIAPEDADATLSKPFNIPTTGVFGLIDLIGVDLIDKAVHTLRAALPASDALHDASAGLTLFAEMVAAGRLGRKAGGGFYRQTKTSDGVALREVFDFTIGAYRTVRAPDPAAASVAKSDRMSPLHDYAQDVMAATLAYASSLVPDVTDSPAEIDAAMVLGYGWRYGPFALLDRLGPARIADRITAAPATAPTFLTAIASAGSTYAADGELRIGGTRQIVPRAPGVIVADSLSVLARNDSASLRDLGDGVGLFEFRTKMNIFDGPLLDLLREVLEAPPGGLRALVIGNDAVNFSAGADLKTALTQSEIGDWDSLMASVRRGQQTFLAMKYGRLPVIGACTGLSLGGGCEILMHCHGVQAHLETQIGLVEANVGLIPAWGGTTQMLLRKVQVAENMAAGAVGAFEVISAAMLAPSAPLGRTAGYLPAEMGLTMNRDRLLGDAKARALALADIHTPTDRVSLKVETSEVRQALEVALDAFAEKNANAPHSIEIARALAWVLGGGGGDGVVDLTEENLHALEQTAFRWLLSDPRTRARMKHTLETGKSLRN